MVDNPFLADRGQQIALALMSLGGGISQAASAGLPAWSGIGPGTANFASAMAMAQQRQRDQQQQDELLDLRRRSMGLQEQELSDKRAERDRLTKAAESYLPPGMGGAAAGLGVPGMRAPVPLPTMGPGFVGQVGTDESANSYTAVNGKGSGAYGKYQFMPDTWASIAAKYPSLGLPTNMRQANPEQQEAAMRALVQENGEGLRRAGFMPTDENLYYAHRFGVNGAGTLLRSDGSAPVSSLFPAQWTAQNPDMAGVTVDQFKNRTQQRYGAAAPANDSAAPPSAPPQVPMPSLPADAAARIQRAVNTRQITPQQGDAESNRIITDLWNRQQTIATEAWKQQVEDWRHNRGLQAQGEWVRDENGRETWVRKADLKPGMRRYDKPKDAGTAEGDIGILGSAKPDSREYLAAYNRVRGRMIDGPGGIKYVPDMSAYDAPTFVAPNAAPAAAPAAGAGTTAAAPPGMTPIEGEKKYTESQGKDHTYALRLDNAIPLLEGLVRKDDGTYSTDRLPSSYERTKASSKFVPDSMVSERAKEFRGVVNDIITATLRRESGATIQPSEFDTEYAKFIPQAGDNDKEIRRKLTALKIAARSIAEGSGRPMANYKNLVGGDAPASGGVAPIRIDMTGRRQ